MCVAAVAYMHHLSQVEIAESVMKSHRASISLGLRISGSSSLVARFRYDMCRKYH